MYGHVQCVYTVLDNPKYIRQERGWRHIEASKPLVFLKSDTKVPTRK